LETIDGASAASRILRIAVFQYHRSIDHAIEVFRTYIGPTSRAFQMTSGEAQEALRKDLRAVFTRYNRATDGTVVIESRYLQTVATRA